jgi:hypothetical protein
MVGLEQHAVGFQPARWPPKQTVALATGLVI